MSKFLAAFKPVCLSFTLFFHLGKKNTIFFHLGKKIIDFIASLCKMDGRMNGTLYSIACDFGSSGGKIFLGIYRNGKMDLEEIHRFKAEPIKVGKYYYTDLLKMYSELLHGLKLIIARGIQPDSLAIDTWGVDCAYLSKNGELIANPINYRSERTFDTPAKLAARGLDAQILFKKTGIAPMPYNTLFQAYEDQQERRELLSSAKHMLMLPDILGYWLTGNISSEPCIASTTQMLNAQSRDWDSDILRAAGLDASLLPPLQESGSTKGELLPELAKSLDCKPFPIIACCSHDTASAVLASPLIDENSVFIASGSWSLMGQEKSSPITSPEALAAGFSNEMGYGKTTRFLKSINGLWTLQLLQRKWDISFAAIEEMAQKELGRGFLIDVTDEVFYGAGDVEEAILNHCRVAGLALPSTRAEMAAAVYEGLGRAHAQFLQELEKITGKAISSVHIVGGGCRDAIFCQSIKSKLNVPVSMGPIDATAIGNLLSQWLGMGAIESPAAAREIVRNSFDVKEL